MKHKHYDMIVAWAEGKKIQFNAFGNSDWEDIDMTGEEWYNHCTYRIKPEPKPDVCVFLKFNTMYGNISRGLGVFDSNIRVTIDGETGQLKSAEVI